MKKFYHLLTRILQSLCVSNDVKQQEGDRKGRPYNSQFSIFNFQLSIFNFAFLFLPFSSFAQAFVQEATVTNVEFSCSGTIEVTYDLVTCGSSVDVTLYYSPDKCNWAEAITVSGTGSTSGQTTGTDKIIIWDAAADNVTFGKFYFKVEYPIPPLSSDPTPVFINGVYWSPVNLDFGGRFCENPWDYGALYQWGRHTDGHECSSSPLIGIQSSTDNPGHSNFIVGFSDWRNPSDALLWNSGTEALPVKTANDPCPDGWRVPTQTEFNTLIQSAVSNQEIAQYGTQGFLFTDNNNSNSIFFPFAGYRLSSNGAFNGYSTVGTYWSSTSLPTTQLSFNFGILFGGTFNNNWNPRASGYSIRCVSEN